MLQATAQVRRRLAELELDMDRQQGWVRGGTKSEVSLLASTKMHLVLCPTPMAWASLDALPITYEHRHIAGCCWGSKERRMLHAHAQGGPAWTFRHQCLLKEGAPGVKLTVLRLSSMCAGAQRPGAEGAHAISGGRDQRAQAPAGVHAGRSFPRARRRRRAASVRWHSASRVHLPHHPGRGPVCCSASMVDTPWHSKEAEECPLQMHYRSTRTQQVDGGLLKYLANAGSRSVISVLA